MNWEAIGAIGEIAAAAGTLAMLVYLSIQIRHAAQTTQSSNELEATKLLTSLGQQVAENPDMRRAWTLVAEDSQDISTEDLELYYWVLSGYAHSTEGVFLQYKQGMISEGLWKKWKNGFSSHVGTTLGHTWWVDNKDIFSDEFYEYIEGILNSRKDWSFQSTNDLVARARKNQQRANDT